MAENRPPTSVTDAQESAEKDYQQRVRRYTISMIIRVVCLLLAFIVSGWLRWTLLAGVVVLPYVAVVIANSRNERIIDYDVTTVDGVRRPVLSQEVGDFAHDAGDDLIVGEIVQAEEDREREGDT